MAEKIIHVNAYTRSDGTYVKEHFRLIDSNGDNSQLKESLVNNLEKSKLKELKLLDELSKIDVGNQADLLEQYAKLKEQNLQDEKILKIMDYFENEGLTKAKRNKQFLDNFISVVGHGKLDDAGQFWNMSSNGFDNDKSQKYITQNGTIYSQIEKLPVEPEIQKAVKHKVKQQLNKDNLMGVIFHENSSIAKNIEADNNFANVINKNFNQLFKGEHINTSINFENNLNLQNALGKVDILDLHINNAGDFEAYVLDTYDFNKDSQNQLVQRGYSAQEHNLINNYYTLVKIIKHP